MKIKQIYIKAFGEIKDITLDFSSDFQIIFGKNESEKTTIQQFIRAMFYDFDTSGFSAETNNRKKYRPWSEESMGGSIVFSFQDRDYRLQKTFAENKANDQIKLISNETEEKIHLKNPHQPGIELFKISETEFINTVFVENLNLDQQKTTDLNSKLNKKIGLAEYDWSYDDMKKRLEKAEIEMYSKRYQNGYIQRLMEQKNTLNEKLNILIEKDEKIVFLNAEIQDKENKIIYLQEREENLNLQKTQYQKLQITNDFTKYQKLDQNLQQLQYHDNLSKNNVLKTGIVNVKDLTEIANQRQKVSNAQSQLIIKQNLIENRQLQKEKYLKEQDKQKSEIMQERSRLNYLKKINSEKQLDKFEPIQMSFTAFIPLTIIEIFLLIGGLLLRKTHAALSVIFIVLAVLLPLLTVFLYFLIRKKQENNYKRYKEAVRKQRMRTLKIENSLEDLEFSLQKIESRSDIYDEEIDALQNEIKNDIEIFERESNKLKYLIKPYFTELPDDNQLDNAISALREKTVDNVHNEEKEKYLKRELQNLRGNLSAAEFYEQYQQAQNWLIEHQNQLRTFPEYSQNHIDSQLTGIAEEKTIISEQLAADKTNLNLLQKNQENTFEVEEELNHVIETLKKAEFRYQSLTLAMHLLEYSKQNFDQSIRPQLNHKAAEYLSIMTGEAYTDLKIDQNFMLYLQDEDQVFKKQANDSSGLNDQVNLALRLALTEILQDKYIQLPLILNDPFVQIDENRSQETLKLLIKITKQQNRQTLFFTSQSSIYKLLENLDDNIKNSVVHL